MHEQNKIRVALFIDGRYLTIINSYYHCVSDYRKKMDIRSLLKIIHKLTAGLLSKKQEDVVFLEKHLYIGVTDQERESFNSEDGADYQKAGITCHISKVIKRTDGRFSEKGVDTSMTLDAFEMVSLDKVDVLVIVTGDEDFVPLVLKTKEYSKEICLFYWHIDTDSEKSQSVYTSNNLIKKVNSSPMGGSVKRCVNMGRIIKEGRLNPFNEESSPKTTPGKTFTTITRREQGRVVDKNELSIFIYPGTGGRNVEYRARNPDEADSFVLGQAVEYNTKKGVIVDLRQPDP